jgi:hypothetical protein
VADQRDDAGSVLRLCRDLIALRRGRDDLGTGAYRPAPGPPGTWVWRRGASTIVALNHGDGSVDVPLDGTILIGTDRGRDGESVVGNVRLRRWEAVIVDVGS